MRDRAADVADDAVAAEHDGNDVGHAGQPSKCFDRQVEPAVDLDP